MAGPDTPSNSQDPIASLYKMSTTAGMGAGDYVEINKMGVASVALAVLSLLALLGGLFLFVGLLAMLAAVLCGASALWQIRHSNGTQGGRAVAWLGIVGAVAVTGYLVIDAAARQATEAADGRQVNALIDQFSKAMAAGDYARARSLFVPEFQEKVPLEKFQSVWIKKTDPERLGRFVSLKGNDRFNFSYGKGGTVYFAFTKAGVAFENVQGDAGTISVFGARPEGDQWRLYDLPDVFEKVMPLPR